MLAERSWAPGFNPAYKPMSEEQTKLFMTASMLSLQQKNEPFDEIERTFLIQILMKRITAMKLPISFTGPGKLAVLALVEIPGELIALLIDCLNAYEGKSVGPQEVADLYPVGFYTKDSFEEYVDKFISAKKVKWHEVY